MRACRLRAPVAILVQGRFQRQLGNRLTQFALEILNPLIARFRLNRRGFRDYIRNRRNGIRGWRIMPRTLGTGSLHLLIRRRGGNARLLVGQLAIVEQQIERHAQRVNVTHKRRHGFLLQIFRRTVKGCAARPPHDAAGQVGRTAEVAQLVDAVAIENVLQLYVLMHQILRVQLLEGFGNIRRNLRHILQLQLADSLLERLKPLHANQRIHAKLILVVHDGIVLNMHNLRHAAHVVHDLDFRAEPPVRFRHLLLAVRFDANPLQRRRFACVLFGDFVHLAVSALPGRQHVMIQQLPALQHLLLFPFLRK